VSKFDPAMTGGALGVTQEGATLGTPFYMPPEQIRGDKHIDQRADIYALGVILYECVGGNRPFNADTLAHLAVLIHEGKPVPLADLRPDLPSRFAEVVHKAMAKEKDQRHASARELAESLAAFTPQVLGPTVGWPGRGKAPPEPARVPERMPESKPKQSEKLLASASYGSGVAIPDSKVPRRSVLPVVLVGGGVAAVAVVGFLMMRPSGRPQADVGTATGAAAPPPVTAVVTAPVAPTVAPPPVEVPAGAPSASASAEPKVPAVKPPLVHPGEKPVVHGDDSQKNAKSRVDQRGLAKDNPFK
jgi:serine/threonine-protein kinase